MSGSQSKERNTAKKCQGQDLGRDFVPAGGEKGGDRGFSYGVSRGVSLRSDQREISALSVSIGGGRRFGGGVGGVWLPEMKLECSILFASSIGRNLDSSFAAIPRSCEMSRLPM